MSTYTKGRNYEEKAAEYLISQGCKILQRNYSPSRLGEIDIIAQDQDELVAVEVKGVNAPWAQDFIAQKVNYKKKLKIIRTLEFYNNSQKIRYKTLRLDVLLLVGDKIIHYKNVWQ